MLTLLSERCRDVQISITKPLTMSFHRMLSFPFGHHWWAEVVGAELVSKGYKYKSTEEEKPQAIYLSEQHCFVMTVFKYLQSRLVLSVKNYQKHVTLCWSSPLSQVKSISCHVILIYCWLTIEPTLFPLSLLSWRVCEQGGTDCAVEIGCWKT